MLRITRVADSPSQVTLKLEGRIVAEWVALLECECLAGLHERGRVILDVAEVTFIDRHGLEMLRRIISSQLRIINASALIEALLRHTGEGNTPDERA